MNRTTAFTIGTRKTEAHGFHDRHCTETEKESSESGRMGFERLSLSEHEIF